MPRLRIRTWKIVSISTIFSWRRHFCYFCHLITISSNLTLLSASLALFDDKCTNSRISAVASSSLSWKSRISSSKLLSKIYQKPQNDYWKTFKRWIQSDMLWSYTNKRKRIIAHKRGCFWVVKNSIWIANAKILLRTRILR